MVCRESSLSSALITFARGASGLEDREVIAINHALIQESSGAVAPSRREWNAFIDRTIEDFQNGRLPVRRGTRNPIPRLRSARTEAVDARRYYAAQRLIERARSAERGHREYLEQYARDFGTSFEDAQLEFGIYVMELETDPTLTASPAFVRSWRADPLHTNLLVDQRSLYVYEQMEINRQARVGATETRPAVTRTEVPYGWIQEIGYDPINGRLEMVARSNPDHVYAYRVSPNEYYDFMEAEGALGSRFTRMISRNQNYLYDSEEESNLAAIHHRCLTCGQFSGYTHYCPVLGSDESINQDTRQAVNRAIAAAGGQGAPTPNPYPLLAGRSTGYQASYNGNAIYMRIPSVSRMTAEARRADNIRARVLSNLTLADGEIISISGQVNVSYLGRGRGYDVSPVTNPGDSGHDNLRCTCPRYVSSLYCEHLGIIAERILGNIRGDNPHSVGTVRSNAARVNSRLTNAFNDSIASEANARNTWKPVATSFEEHPELFKEMYSEAKATINAYKRAVVNRDVPEDMEYPIPYIRENAFAGLAKRGSKRAFGTEIEFSLPVSMNGAQRRNALVHIGEQLYALGLTSTSTQRGYGASHNRYSDSHNRGWSFETDTTTEFEEEAASGGELVSPIMYDEPETWENLEKVCKVLKDNGAIPSKGAGGHIHVGVGDYDHRIENHNRLLQSFKENEDLFYRMATNPERGTHRGQEYCTPNPVPSRPYTLLDRVKRQQDNHHAALNFEGVNGSRKDHVEFRAFDSSLNPAIIQAQIGLSVYMAEGVLRGGSTLPDENAHPLGTNKERLGGREPVSGPKWLESTQSIRKLIDRFVPGAEEGPETANIRAKQLVSLFAMTKWQEQE